MVTRSKHEMRSCGSAGPSSQREESEEPPLPSVEPSVEATRGAEIVNRSECPETTLLPTIQQNQSHLPVAAQDPSC